MSLVGELIVGALTVVFGLGGLVYLGSAIRESAEAGRVVTGPKDLPSEDEEVRTYLDGTLADGPDAGPVTLGQVHDTFGYWLVRHGAVTGSRRNAFTILFGSALGTLYGPGDYRHDGDRRRGWTVAPDTVPVRVDGELLEVTFEDGVRPLQRLEADGMTVPALAGLGGTLWALGLLAAPLLVYLSLAIPQIGLVAGGFTVALVGGLVAGKVYHDTGLVGRWSTVTDVDDDGVPAAVAAADDTPDPDGTAKCNVAEVAPGETLGVVGTVEPTPEGLRVVDGVVSTRGRGFLAVAATLDAVRTTVFAAVALVVAGVGVVLLRPSLVGL